MILFSFYLSEAISIKHGSYITYDRHYKFFSEHLEILTYGKVAV